ncbi:alpha-L-fucosidase [Sphingomonas jinjuensis]|uniref:alpha-L-fucosidase n=1 Tax=Sphingomonas jinjuensis TaxID=535907 RepID=A0A840FCU4_9SPHN|nr:alpha-L-fucosidase [Sphingomonas jinjuensis]MBB4154551.1 alpha-L-fucosidase [Sphingomonas jinjuensis]
MTIDRRTFLSHAAATAGASLVAARVGARAAPAAFQPSWSSLVAGYRAPEWFRDAKFGIWAHWSAQCVPEAGDWYAREMYLPGSRAYAHHLKHYGHPADTGFMQMYPRWTAARWDPERLIALYKRAGARYFMALANHHDNFDSYASSHHPWNATRIGPKRDIVGEWERAARAAGMRFAVSNHSAHAWHWYQPAYGYDPEGPRAGERYDAATLTRAKSVGQWWEGLDPQTLYTGATMPMPAGLTSIAAANAWHEANDRIWNEAPPAGNPGFVRLWTARCRELIDRYRPDMVYFDNQTLPLGQAGLDMAAYAYNQSMRWNGGDLQAVVTAKATPPERRPGIVDVVERGTHDSIQAYPFQTETCLGNWHYDRDLYARDGYKTPRKIIHTLCDVVAKNGNMMLSVPMRGDGTIDDKEEAIVEAIAAWMGRYGDLLSGSRPWRILGEGPTASKGGQFAEGGQDTHYTPADVRYVRQGAAVGAFTLGWPGDGIARFPVLARIGVVRRVTIPGDASPLAFRRTADALEVTLPAAFRNDIGVGVRIEGDGLV